MVLLAQPAARLGLSAAPAEEHSWITEMQVNAPVLGIAMYSADNRFCRESGLKISPLLLRASPD